MLYENDYNSLFSGAVNTDPEEEKEEEKMEEKKSLKDLFCEFFADHKDELVSVAAGTAIAASCVLAWIAGRKIHDKIYLKGYNKGVDDGWNKFYQCHMLMWQDEGSEKACKILDCLRKTSV